MLKVGDIFHCWKITEQLSIEYYSSVYKAIHINSNDVRILKEIYYDSEMTSDSSHSGQTKDDIVKSINTIRTLEHPGIVKIYDYYITDDSVVVVLEYIEGLNLQQYVQKNGVLSEKKAVSCMKTIATFLQYVHDKGLVHLDLKPSNIMLKDNGDLVLIDFGAARIAGSKPSKNDFQTVVFSGPERKLRQPYDIRSDIYSFGQTMYFLLTMTLSRDGNIKLPENKRNKRVSKRVEEFLRKCMNSEPQYRYRNCKEIIQELSEIEDELRKKRWGSFVKGMGIVFFITLILSYFINNISIPTISGVFVEKYFNKIIRNRSLIMSVSLTVLILLIKVLVRQNDPFLKKVSITLIELPMDILGIVAGYVCASFVSGEIKFSLVLFFMIVIMTIMLVCFLCYSIEHMLITKTINKLHFAFNVFASYLMSLVLLAYVSI